MDRRRAPLRGHPPPPLLPSSVDVGALDQECDPYVGAPLVEVLTAQSGGDDVDRADVPERALRLLQRLLCGVIRRLLGASDQLNDLYDGHEPSSFQRDGFAASVLLHLRPSYKPGSGAGRDSPAIAEAGSRRDALPERRSLPAAHLGRSRCRRRLPEEALESRGDRRGLVGGGGGALNLDLRPRRALLAVAPGHAWTRAGCCRACASGPRRAWSAASAAPGSASAGSGAARSRRRCSPARPPSRGWRSGPCSRRSAW